MSIWALLCCEARLRHALSLAGKPASNVSIAFVIARRRVSSYSHSVELWMGSRRRRSNVVDAPYALDLRRQRVLEAGSTDRAAGADDEQAVDRGGSVTIHHQVRSESLREACSPCMERTPHIQASGIS